MILLIKVNPCISGLTVEDIEKGMILRAKQDKSAEADAGMESLTICYLVSVILGILVLVSVIVITTVITTDNKLQFI